MWIWWYQSKNQEDRGKFFPLLQLWLFIFTVLLFLLKENHSPSLFCSLTHRLIAQTGQWERHWDYCFVSSILTDNYKIAFPYLPIMLEVLILCGLFLLPVDFMECWSIKNSFMPFEKPLKYYKHRINVFIETVTQIYIFRVREKYELD